MKGMKSLKFYVAAVVLLLFTAYETMNAQVTIGADELPQTFSVLELKSNYDGKNAYGGLRLPKLSEEEKRALDLSVDPVKAVGLMIYNTTIDCVQYWDGREWIDQCKSECHGVVDIEGNYYPARRFGSAGCWMTQNLRVKQYADGESLVANGNATTNSQRYYWYPGYTGSASEHSITLLNDHPEYGLQYTWAAASRGSSSDQHDSGAGKRNSMIQGICPDGWVLPSDKEWCELEKELACNPSEYSSSDTDIDWDNWEAVTLWRPRLTSESGHGKTMKSSNKVIAPQGGELVLETDGASKPSPAGFDVLLLGATYEGKYHAYGEFGYFWSSSISSKGTWYFHPDRGSERVYRSIIDKAYYFNVRCKKVER